MPRHQRSVQLGLCPLLILLPPLLAAGGARIAAQTAAPRAVHTRPADILFTPQLIDPGASETAAVVDIDGDGRLDIVSGEHWYAGPNWTKHRFRDLNYTNNYVDAFSDLAFDADEDGFPDLVTVSWFDKKISWWKNPGRGVAGKAGATATARWTETIVDSGFPVEFAVLVDLDNDGKAREVLPQSGDAKAPLAWYEFQRGAWVKHVVSPQSYGHGIGAGDVNGDGRMDILTPQGWFEAPANLRDKSAEGRASGSGASGGGASGGAAGAGAAGGAGGWTHHADWAEKTQFGFIYALDINGDGRRDILTTSAHDYGLFWLEQGAKGEWTRRSIDQSWSQAHASTLTDLNGDGRPDLITGKRYMAHNGNDPGEREPLGLYWYEHRKAPNGAAEWIRHVIDYGGRAGGGMQIPVVDLDGDGDLDLVCAGKSGLFVVLNATKVKPAATKR